MSTSNRRCVISGQNQMFIRDNNVREIRNTDINNDAIAMREVDCRSRRENDAIATRDRDNDSRCRRDRDNDCECRRRRCC